jgi:hypothetical protein
MTGPAAIGNGQPRLPARLAVDPHRPWNRLRGAARAPRPCGGYLNATPQSGAETLANWSRFRPAHNHQEGDRNVVTDATATHLRFRAGTGSCVVDHYVTVTARYHEIACIVRGSRATTVVVAAARAQDWADLAPALRRSVASFST